MESKIRLERSHSHILYAASVSLTGAANAQAMIQAMNTRNPLTRILEKWVFSEI